MRSQTCREPICVSERVYSSLSRVSMCSKTSREPISRSAARGPDVLSRLGLDALELLETSRCAASFSKGPIFQSPSTSRGPAALSKHSCAPSTSQSTEAQLHVSISSREHRCADPDSRGAGGLQTSRASGRGAAPDTDALRESRAEQV